MNAPRRTELPLVLDNCEHVLVAAAALVDRLLRHCPAAGARDQPQPIGIPGGIAWRSAAALFRLVWPGVWLAVWLPRPGPP